MTETFVRAGHRTRRRVRRMAHGLWFGLVLAALAAAGIGALNSAAGNIFRADDAPLPPAGTVAVAAYLAGAALWMVFAYRLPPEGQPGRPAAGTEVAPDLPVQRFVRPTRTAEGPQ